MEDILICSFSIGCGLGLFSEGAWSVGGKVPRGAFYVTFTLYCGCFGLHTATDRKEKMKEPARPQLRAIVSASERNRARMKAALLEDGPSPRTRAARNRLSALKSRQQRLDETEFLATRVVSNA